MSEDATTANPMNGLYFIISLIISVILAYKYGDEKHLEVSFFMRVLILISGTLVGYLGGVIGDFIRKLAIPDAIFTDGKMASILKAKIFWFIGPQLIGIGIGSFFGAGLIGKLYGHF